jgi:hypothetical protein
LLPVSSGGRKSIAYCVSFPNTIEAAIESAFGQWLEDHSTEIIAAIAKAHAESTN